MRRFKSLKVYDDGIKRNFFALAVVTTSTRKKLKNDEYFFLLGRLSEKQADFFKDKENKIWTIGGSENNHFLILTDLR